MHVATESDDVMVRLTVDDLRRVADVAAAAPPGPWTGVVGVATTQVFAANGHFVAGGDVTRMDTHRYLCTAHPVVVQALVAEVQAWRDAIGDLLLDMTDTDDVGDVYRRLDAIAEEIGRG